MTDDVVRTKRAGEFFGYYSYGCPVHYYGYMDGSRRCSCRPAWNEPQVDRIVYRVPVDTIWDETKIEDFHKMCEKWEQ